MTRFMKSLNMNFNNGLINKRILSLWMAFLLVLVIGPAYATTYLKDFDGAIHSLDEYTGQGKWAIVMIWASDCQACNQEAENYVKFNKKHISNFLNAIQNEDFYLFDDSFEWTICSNHDSFIFLAKK